MIYAVTARTAHGTYTMQVKANGSDEAQGAAREYVSTHSGYPGEEMTVTALPLNK